MDNPLSTDDESNYDKCIFKETLRRSDFTFHFYHPDARVDPRVECTEWAELATEAGVRNTLVEDPILLSSVSFDVPRSVCA